MTILKRIPLLVAEAFHSIDLRDVFVFGGLGIAVRGVAEFSVPTAWIVCGIVLFAMGIRR